MSFSVQAIGQISLNISFALYLIYLLPQLLHNYRHKQIKNLSLLMHSVLSFAYVLDLIYAFGRQMPWQYKCVSIIGLICLSIQHIQFYHQQRQDKTFLFKYFFLSTALTLLLAVGWLLLFNHMLEAKSLILINTISQLAWMSYALPQIIINLKLKSTSGISLHFVIMACLINLCDTVSAWMLLWDWSLRVGSPVLLLIKLSLLTQFIIFQHKPTNRR